MRAVFVPYNSVVFNLWISCLFFVVKFRAKRHKKKAAFRQPFCGLDQAQGFSVG